ncbi:hypothetical protein ElyMa_001558800 [Elysia marginata]|uniref:Uncharacterized protein n=1 Tax=Elysia marginata TaxID=1093978 RepID=A0AAV4JDZ9_9GAST|nr:hypothetical protein ElyMa_001558800 [Elysia marginata]
MSTPHHRDTPSLDIVNRQNIHLSKRTGSAEYCAHVWTRSPNTELVDVKLRDSMRTIGGCLKSTLIQWLPYHKLTPQWLTHARREDATQKIIKRIEDMADNMPLKQIYKEALTTRRLKS